MEDKYDFGPWIAHIGMDCPVPADLLVDVYVLREVGNRSVCVRPARVWGWDYGARGQGRVLAYRVATPSPRGAVTAAIHRLTELGELDHAKALADALAKLEGK